MRLGRARRIHKLNVLKVNALKLDMLKLNALKLDMLKLDVLKVDRLKLNMLKPNVGSSSRANYLMRNAAMDDSIGGS